MSSLTYEKESRWISIYTKLINHLRTPLYRNGYALTLSSAATSGIGLLYWLLAAHRYPTSVIGINSAVISAMMFLAGVSELNLMSALIRFIPTSGKSTKKFVLMAYLISLVLSAILSYVFVRKIQVWSPALRFLDYDDTMGVWFILSTMVWTIFVLQDSVLTGLRNATWVPVENTVFSLAKIGLMIVFAASFPVFGIFASWSIALVIAIIPTNYYIFRRLIPHHEQAEGQKNNTIQSKQVIQFVAADYTGALLWMVCTLLLPVIVTTLAGATANAYFYLAWTISNSLYLIGPNMGSSLVVEAAKDPQKLGTYSRRVYINTAKIVIPASVFLIMSAPLILTVFGKGYSSQGTTLLRLLALSAIPNTFNTIFVSVSRVRRNMRAVIATLGSLCVIVLSLSFVLLKTIGVVGVGIAWVVGQSIVASVVYTTQLRYLWGSPKEDSRQSARKYFRVDRVGFRHFSYQLVSKLGLFSVIKTPLDGWALHKRRIQVSKVLPELINQDSIQNFSRTTNEWHVQQIAYTTTGRIVAFLGLPGCAPSAVLKIPGNAQDLASLDKQNNNIATLLKITELAEWRNLIPVTVAQGMLGGREFFLEPVMPGVPLEHILEDAEARPRLIGLAACTINELHMQTAREEIIGTDQLRKWVHEPLGRLRCLAVNRAPLSPYRTEIDRLSINLHTTLAGRKVSTCWIHGDYSPENILVNPACDRVTGIVDWDLACASELPQLDLIHLFLSIRMQLSHRELGAIVCELLLKDNWLRSERFLLEQNQTGETLDSRTLLLLAWLRHVNANLIKTSHLSHHTYWVTENIGSVLGTLTI